jgi:hypothetical protein
LSLFPYHFIALRRVFGGSRLAILLKGTTAALAYLVAMMAAVLAILALKVGLKN